MLKTKRRVFSQLEDQTIRDYVLEHGENWDEIAKLLSGRTAKQCHDRYENYLRDGLKSEPWSPEEDEILIRMYKEIGPKWVKMMKNLPGRSGNNIKNRWHKHLIKKEKYILNHQMNEIEENINLRYNALRIEPSNLKEKLQTSGSFLIEPIIGNSNQKNNMKPEDKNQNNINPNIIVTKKIPLCPSSANNIDKKVDGWLPLPPVNFDLFDVVDITDKFLEEIFDEFNVKQDIGSYYDQFFSYV